MPFQFDFFSGLSTFAAILGAYAAWKSYKTSKRIEELQDLRIDIELKEITCEEVPDTHWHTIKLQMTNLSTIAAFIKKMSLKIHGKEYELHSEGTVVLQPFVPTEIYCTMGSWGSDILDGRYPATLILKTDRKNITCQFKESDFILPFHLGQSQAHARAIEK